MLSIHTNISLCCQLRRPRSKDVTVATSTCCNKLMSRSWFLKPFSNKRNHGSLEKWPSLGPGQEISKMIQEHFVVPESKKVFPPKAPTMMGVYPRDTLANWKSSSGQSWNDLSNKISKVVLDYNPNCKINTIHHADLHREIDDR